MITEALGRFVVVCVVTGALPTTMSDAGVAAPVGHVARERGWHAPAVIATLWFAVIANGGAIVWLWLHGGGVSGVHSLTDLWTSLGRVTGLLAVYLALGQILLLARLPPLERLVGFDRLTVWHRTNGKACLVLVLAHVVFITLGYAGLDQVGLSAEINRLVSDYPGMVAAVVGTALMIGVVATSIVIVRRRLPYEAWYTVHLSVYAGIVLAYVHQPPTGNEFTANAVQLDYWIALYVAVLAVLVWFRVVAPIRAVRRHRLRVEEVIEEAPGIHSVVIAGRALDRLGAHGGQFMTWRFLDRRRWWQAHPFSLSALPHDGRMRITVKGVGRYTHDLAQLRRGTRVVAEGPFGRFTAERCRREGALLIAGGIGITPIRTIIEELPPGPVDVIHRVMHEDELVFTSELDEIAAQRGAHVHRLVGDHRDPQWSHLLSPFHLRELVPEVCDREVFVCGPPAMVSHILASLRTLGVTHRHIHTERFALAS